MATDTNQPGPFQGPKWSPGSDDAAEEGRAWAEAFGKPALPPGFPTDGELREGLEAAAAEGLADARAALDDPERFAAARAKLLASWEGEG